MRKGILLAILGLGLAILLCSVFIGMVSAVSAEIEDSIVEGMKELDVEKGDPNLCVLTDATYIKKAKYIDSIRERTGCSIGKENLLLFHRAIDYPLIIAMFKKGAEKDNCYVITLEVGESKAVLTTIPTITKEEREKEWESEYWVNWETSNETQDSWRALEADLGKIGLKGDAFSITTIANAWALDAPYDFLRCAEWHNHICPGLTSGYLITGYIRENYPLEKGEKYIFIACPPWCKDDAIQTIFDLTPGKRSLFVKQLSDEQRAKLPEDVAGILVKWNGKEKKGTGAVLQFDWDKTNEISNIDRSTYHAWGSPIALTARVKGDWALMPYLDRPEVFVKTANEFDVSSEMLAKLEEAGVNPYVEIGLMEEEKKGEEVPSIPGIAVITAIAIASAVVYVTKRKKGKG